MTLFIVVSTKAIASSSANILLLCINTLASHTIYLLFTRLQHQNPGLQLDPDMLAFCARSCSSKETSSSQVLLWKLFSGSLKDAQKALMVKKNEQGIDKRKKTFNVLVERYIF